MKTVAEALHYAHGQRLIHRDVKPANILIEESTRTPFGADFGLAIREEDYAKQGGLAGTPTYMSPEQARGEGHRLDGRSDVFSMGVILYEALTGKRPFRGGTLNELLHQIVSVEPRAPRSLREDIPAELERICLKSLNKRVSDRYASAAALAEDFAAWLQPKATQPIQSQREEQIVPKGLRSFDASDAGYFLDLLPGPRNRQGLPEIIAFWKQRIEQTDPEQTFSVGLIYGPSGCGKSSLVKAGLIPHLDKDIVAVYVEATPEDTEVRILRGIRKRLPELSEQQGLADTLAALRRAQGRKVLIIIDQFEQWLHAHRTETEAELVKALRQCDGGRLQAIVMIRDDFAMAAARFMNALDVPIVQGENFAMVDLFDVDHAAKVIIRLGQAFSKLPANAGNLSTEEQQFVSAVSQGLAQDGKVVSVRLSLFAEMVKGKPWTPTTLKQVGGTKGIGVNFLEETFSSPQANPRHRLHAVAARSVLTALLPELGTDIKGHMRSQAELLSASGYEDRPSDFNDLLRILDGELRLITPTDPEGESLSNSPRHSSLATRYFQLTHDYLVPSLREWLTRKQRETRKGRAELKLAERAATWSDKKENQQLPTLSEWLSIHTLTESKKWTVSERTVMQRAGRVHVSWWGGLVLATLLLGFGIQRWISSARWKDLQNQTLSVADLTQNTLGSGVPFNLKELGKLRDDLVLPELRNRFALATNQSHKLSLAFALAQYGNLDSDYLVSRVDDIAESDTGNYVTALKSNVPIALGSILTESAKCVEKSLWRHKAKLAIMALNLGDTKLALDMCEVDERPDPEQRTLFIDEFPRWENHLKDVHDLMTSSDSPALRSGICLAVGQITLDKLSDDDKERWQSLASRWFVEKGDTTTHSAAGWLLRRWGVAEPKVLEREKIIAQRDWFVNSLGATMLKIRSNSTATVKLVDPLEKIRKRLSAMSQLEASELDKPVVRMERAIALYRIENIEAALEDLNWLLVHVENMNPEEKNVYLTEISNWRALAFARLGNADEARKSLETHLEKRRFENLGNYSDTAAEIQVPAWLGDFTEVASQLDLRAKDMFKTGRDNRDDDARVASLCSKAALAKSPEQAKQFADRAFEILGDLISGGYKDKKKLLEDLDFASLHKDVRFGSLIMDIGTIKEFWVADREVSRGQYELFMNDASYPENEKPKKPDEFSRFSIRISPTTEHPVQNVSWYDSVMFCNWLSQSEGRKPCYERTGETEKSFEGTFDVWRFIQGSNGYRLLSEEEWVYACRAGTKTRYSMGNDDTFLVSYCQMFPHGSTSLCGDKIPNGWGLHDVHGNVWEWCEYQPNPLDRAIKVAFWGGGWDRPAVSCDSDSKSKDTPSRHTATIGFRLALSPSVQSPEAKRNNENK